jgi:hypothetical protein
MGRSAPTHTVASAAIVEPAAARTLETPMLNDLRPVAAFNG